MAVPALVGIDWGTTNARAYVLGEDGAILAQTDDQAGNAQGIMHIQGGDFPGALEALLDDLALEVPPGLPILLSGMITSRQGWVETVYVDCPAGLADIAEAAERQVIDDRTLIFAPGLTFADQGGVPDVMRGEEMQILGLLAAGGPEGLHCLPGTHSKWAWTAGGRIERFSTVMTGEVYAALCNHTILGRLMGARTHHPEAFAQGAARARAGGYVLHDIFAARTEGLFERLRPDALAAYLSGLLIGHEVAAMTAALQPGTPITVIGGAALADRYGAVLRAAGFDPVLRSDPVVSRGQLELARAMGAL